MSGPKRPWRIATLSPIAMGVVVGLLVLVPCIAVSGSLYLRSVEAIHEEIRGNLVRIAKAASVLVDPELHKTFRDPSQESTTEYERAIAPLREFIERDASFKYVYTFVEVDGKIYFILDPTPAGDSDGDGVDDKSHIMQHYDEDGLENMFAALRSHVAVAEEEFDDDMWGTFISGYAPIFDKNGEFVACIGVDVTADRYAARLASIRTAGATAGIVSLIVSALVGIAAGLVHHRRAEVERESEKARESLAELAESLDLANAQLRIASRRFEQLFNSIPVACFTIDCEGTIYEWNREAQRLISFRADEVVQKSVFNTIVGERNRELFERIVNMVSKGASSLDVEWSDGDALGGDFTVIINAFPLYSHEGKVTGGIFACSDITMRKIMQQQIEQQVIELQNAYRGLDESQSDLQQANERLSRLAAIDSLTGIKNRRTAFEALEKAISSARRTMRPLSILMIDIDRFKALNDQHGHLAGDAVLKHVAGLLQSSSRRHDELGRYGGEEFLMVLPETDGDEALRTAERIRKAVESRECQRLRVTVSIGVATHNSRMATSEQFIDAADRALYHAKRTGRNRVVHSRDLTDEGAA